MSELFVSPTCVALTRWGIRCTRAVNYVVRAGGSNARVLLLCGVHATHEPGRLKAVTETLDYRAYPVSVLEAIARLEEETMRSAQTREEARAALDRLTQVHEAIDGWALSNELRVECAGYANA
jgi:hypothetical protein